mmetsp:Transcript_20376/g.40721  ORF Transcript_20376/g.40721 Transcript_20376/m.40721 type:complete len:273 (+) Transcript_20376:1012-1830(+)
MFDSIPLLFSFRISITFFCTSRSVSVKMRVMRSNSSPQLSAVDFPRINILVIMCIPSTTANSSAPSGSTEILAILALIPPVCVPILRDNSTSVKSVVPDSIIRRVKRLRRGASERGTLDKSTPKSTYAIPDVEESSCLMIFTPETSSSSTSMGYSFVFLFRSSSSKEGIVATDSGESSAACRRLSSLVVSMIPSTSSSESESLIFFNLDCSSLTCSSSMVLDGTISIVTRWLFSIKSFWMSSWKTLEPEAAIEALSSARGCSNFSASVGSAP